MSNRATGGWGGGEGGIVDNIIGPTLSHFHPTRPQKVMLPKGFLSFVIKAIFSLIRSFLISRFWSLMEGKYKRQKRDGRILQLIDWICLEANSVKTRRYSLLRGGLRPSAEAFLALRAKKELIILFLPIFGIFWSPVITLVTFSSNIGNNNKKTTKSTKIQKFQNNSKNPKIQRTSKK